MGLRQGRGHGHPYSYLCGAVVHGQYAWCRVCTERAWVQSMHRASLLRGSQSTFWYLRSHSSSPISPAVPLGSEHTHTHLTGRWCGVLCVVSHPGVPWQRARWAHTCKATAKIPAWPCFNNNTESPTIPAEIPGGWYLACLGL